MEATVAMKHDEANEATKDSLEDVDIEVADATKVTSKQDGAVVPVYKRPKVLAIMALMVVIVVIIALIPTVFLDSEEDSGPHFAFNEQFEGKRVRLAKNGTRMFIGTQIDHYHDGGIIEVYDFENGAWISKSSVIYTGPEGGRRLHEGHSLHDFEVSNDGKRLVGIAYEMQDSNNYEWKVGAFAESPNGTEWFQVGEPLDWDHMASLEVFAYAYPCGDGIPRRADIGSANFGFDSVALSDDGNTILVTNDNAYYSYENCANRSSYESIGGAIQAFQFPDLVSESRQEFANSTWIPKGQMLLGGRRKHPYRNIGWAQNAVMAGNGMRIVAGQNEVRIFDYNVATNQWNDVETNVPTALRNLKYARDVFAISHDGKTIAIAQADDSPSAYLEDPYRGEVTLYTDTGTIRYGSLRFDSFQLRGEKGFQHFGSSIALNGDFLVVGSEKSRGRGGANDFPDGDKINVFAKNATGGWSTVGPVLGHPVIEDGWRKVAISPDGQRIAGVGYRDYSDSSVLVFDFEE